MELDELDQGAWVVLEIHLCACQLLVLKVHQTKDRSGEIEDLILYDITFKNNEFTWAHFKKHGPPPPGSPKTTGVSLRNLPPEITDMDIHNLLAGEEHGTYKTSIKIF